MSTLSHLLALALVIALVLSLTTLVGEDMANGIMWAVAGWKLGEWAVPLGYWIQQRLPHD